MEKNTDMDRARKTLKLGEEASILEIKEAYRKLSLKYHPDKCKDTNKTRCEEKFKLINNANETIIEYCLNYKISFKEKENSEKLQDREMKEHMNRFYSDWL